MSWMINEGQLDPDQRDFLDSEIRNPGNIWVQGFAGSGKSVLMVHAIREILDREPNASICIVVFTNALADLFQTGMAELGFKRPIRVLTYYKLESENIYDYIFCDEVQDLPLKALNLLTAKSRKLYVAGDVNQSIYAEDPSWREPVVNPLIIGGTINARPFELKRIHRLTRSIMNAVNLLLPATSIWLDKLDATKQDVEIRLVQNNSKTKEIEFIWEKAQETITVPGKPTAVLLPHHKSILNFIQSILEINGKVQWTFRPVKWDVSKPTDKQRPDYDSLNSYLKSNNIKVEYVGNNHGSLRSAESNKNLIVMTYHSSKGLDFDTVFLPFMDDSISSASCDDETIFMVALTRSRRNLYLSYVNSYNFYVDRISSACRKNTSGSIGLNNFDY